MKFNKFILLFLLLSAALFNGCSDETNPVTPPEEHFEPEGWLIRDATLKPVLVVFQGVIQNTWNGTAVDTIFKAPLNALSDHYSVKFLNANKEIINQPSGTGYSLGVVITDTSVAGYVKDSPTDWAFHLKGKKLSTTTVELQVVHSNHADVKTPKIPVVVVEDTSAYGEPVGLRLSYEDGSGIIFSASGAAVTGSFEIRKDSLSEHIKIEFVDENGRYFQPEYPLHTLGISITDGNIIEVLPEAGEPWVIKIRGKNAGAASFRLKVLVGSEEEYISPALPVTVVN